MRAAGANNGGFRERVGPTTRPISQPHADWMRQTVYSTRTPRRFAHRIATACADEPTAAPTAASTDQPPMIHR